jgi:hypothetical protein
MIIVTAPTNVKPYFYALKPINNAKTNPPYSNIPSGRLSATLKSVADGTAFSIITVSNKINSK